MDLAPCNEVARQALVNSLFEVDDQTGIINRKTAEYVAKTFPSILLDIARLLVEQATTYAQNNDETLEPAASIRFQLRPYLMFNLLLGKAPQATSLMYSYFERSSFQPLPENLFKWDTEEERIVYSLPGFNDDLVQDILVAYFKYLSFNPKWFSTIWNWSELGRFIALHTNHNIRYIAACCLSVITKPERFQHISLVRETIGIDNYSLMIDTQVKHRELFDNTFKPLIETKHERAREYCRSLGYSQSGYSYDTESLTKVANVLLLKREINHLAPKELELFNQRRQQTLERFVTVETLYDVVSKIAYSVSINKPCLIRGTGGCGKTAILDYIAAHTCRLNPPDYIKVQIGDQIDSKLLIGSYVCTEIPGQFEWQPGPLARAMAYGSWIVFEDIDTAPADLAQVIHSVIENGSLSCISSCPLMLDNPHPDFRIFFTQRSRKSPSQTTADTLSLGFGFVERLCDIVNIPELNDDDLTAIILARYKFGDLTPTLLRLYRMAEASLDVASNMTKARQITLRDLFKFCDRVASLKLSPTDNSYSTRDLDLVLLDAIDCFLHSLSEDLFRLAISELGKVLNKSAEDTGNLIFRRSLDVKESHETLRIGRAELKRTGNTIPRSKHIVAHTNQALILLECVSMCISCREPVLLVGETGVGKTTIVQHLANCTRNDLIVVNLSQQSDSSDLLGGYKPVEMREIMKPIHERFVDLLRRTWDSDANRMFLEHVENLYTCARQGSETSWATYLGLLCNLCNKSLDKGLTSSQNLMWRILHNKVRRLSARLRKETSASSMALSFSEGSLLAAIKEGKWILLDEINLAEPEVLQCLLLILDSIRENQAYINIANENSGVVQIHRNFRLFACMNPSTDIGKKELPQGIRGRFTEFFVDDIISKRDLRLIVESYVKTCFQPKLIECIVSFYLKSRDLAPKLSDISGNSPVYSLRTLCRALTICSANVCHNAEKSLVESLKTTFFQQLSDDSINSMIELIQSVLFDKSKLGVLEKLTIPKPHDGLEYVEIEGFWIRRGKLGIVEDEKYIITDSVRRNLKNLCRIICLSQRRLPVLIQGKTSVGKTSLVTHLAKITGNRCVRINNHEHTDLQEYVGRYVLTEKGELAFQEGLLVRAMKHGFWLILDELNLAPSELLEALNRVLDDNRELFIPETRQIVKAHPNFVVFATQNPPEEYAGRKVLSRAFRNRFIELHFDEIPHNELEYILKMRCQMPAKYAKKIVVVMRELQKIRRESGCFNGKGGFMTMRDLFRWGERYLKFKRTVPDDKLLDWDQQLANDGLILLEGRVRTFNEANTVKGIIEKTFTRKLNRDEIYSKHDVVPESLAVEYRHIYFTPEFRRLFVQLQQALSYDEPVLLCGQTGCGKTTACQLYAAIAKQDLITYNCHLNTESSDFIGDVRPSRSRSSTSETNSQIFTWVDGPLIEAMKKGSVFLMDEISLSDDAVLERINSVLEPERSITLSEMDGREIQASEHFRFVATMNPGGDYGKKELSIALRNRFTEIYCHNTTDMSSIAAIIERSLCPALLKPKIAPALVAVMKDFLQEYYKSQDIVSLRDVLSWTKFLNITTQLTQPKPLALQEALIHGASLVFFDQFGSSGFKIYTTGLPLELKQKLSHLLKQLVMNNFDKDLVYLDRLPVYIEVKHDMVAFQKFYLPKGPCTIYEDIKKNFILEAPIVKDNMMKIVRAMQLDRPILLEGDPGAGKTSIVSALAKLTGHKLTRINLSEQTDISDLFGSDLPDSSDLNQSTPRFSWHDGPVLRAIKHSHWILLDEMNLASQSVLEGLNACLDHRGEIFIPELGKKFRVDRSTTRFFACQNPYSQGAARKGLPQSFLNRFTTIFIEPHTEQDLQAIISNLYPMISSKIIKKMIQFNTEVSKVFADFDYEFNLRDLLYWCELTTKYVRGEEPTRYNLLRPDKFVQFVYLDRMRSNASRITINEIFERIFGLPIYEPPYRDIRLGEYSFIMGRSMLFRKNRPAPHLADLCILKYQMPFIESIAKAIECTKMPILVGESGVGKHSMIKILAGLTGNELRVIGANREMDTVELLGSYEQQSLQREMVLLIDESKSCVTEMVNSISQKRNASTWTQLFKHSWSALFATSVRDLNLSKSELMDTYRFQLIQMRDLVESIQPLCSSKVEKKCRSLREKIDRIMKKFLYDAESMYSTGNFEWVDSALVKSVRDGSWLMIANANLLNPATLDRLNSLVEPNGSLSLNEKGSGSNGIEVIKPHPNFRLILTMDPAFGELSRAMRNRGVEIFIQTRFYFEDYLMLLNQNGFEPEEKKACMAYCIMQTSYDVHEKITGSEPMKDEEGSPLAYFGLNYISTLTHQVRRGMDVDRTLSELLTAFYHQKGFLEDSADTSIYSFVSLQMNKYRKTYEVNLVDERYKWFNLRHDLVAMSGGDAIAVMVNRDNKIFFEDSPVDLLLKPDEFIDHIDIVNTCIAVKIFLELSTHGDFEYRKGFIRETFQVFHNMMKIVNNHVDLLHSEYIPLINNLLPKASFVPVSEMHIDTRNSPDVHHYLQTLDFKNTKQIELQQNRWLLSLQRIMLCMVVELIEERSVIESEQQDVSLWTLSERVKTGSMLREDLIRPTAEIATDIYDLLNGIMRVVSNRCFDNAMVAKMMPRFFWISYFICKLKRAQTANQLVALCNQLPMLWALTFQKVLSPVARECNLSDLSYKNKKFSNRIKHICNFLDITMTKPSQDEKVHCKKVLNMQATTTKLAEKFSREIETIYSRLLGKYNSKTIYQIEGARLDILTTSNLVWTNSSHISQLYLIQDMLLLSDIEENLEVQQSAAETLKNTKNDHNQYNELEIKTKLGDLSVRRETPNSDQFSPVWQLVFLRHRQSRLDLDQVDIERHRSALITALKKVNGLLMSPRYYSTVMRCLLQLASVRQTNTNSVDPEHLIKKNRDHADIYSAFLLDHLLENIVLDNQVVNWTKLRVTTSDLSSNAPLVPEYSPIISLVASYCLDISHLKLNSHRNNSPHLESFIVYLWRAYKLIKQNTSEHAMDTDLARRLVHMRCKSSRLKHELVGDHRCNTEEGPCSCLEVLISKRSPNYANNIMRLKENVDHPEDLRAFIKAIDLIYFGYYSFVEFAPIFTLDPALRSREKLEVYKSELAHIKLDLHARNTLFYWKTGENLRLNEIDSDEAILYPFSTRVLVERRVKLEKAIEKLRKNYTTRPKSDDGSIYYELRKEVEVNMSRYRYNVESLMKEFIEYVMCKTNQKKSKLSNLNTRSRMLIKSLEKTITQMRSEYALYSDLMTNCLAGMCFLLQGLRRLYSRLEQKMQIIETDFLCSTERFALDIIRLFSFNNLNQCNLETVHNKLSLIPVLGKLCPSERTNYIQSILLKASLMQLNHHITITPSDIESCITIVRNITMLFQSAWLKRKLYLEEQKKKQQELYRYKPVRTALGQENTYEQQEFIDICTKFPVYDHIFRGFFMAPTVSTEVENLETEEKIINLNRSVDLSLCIDICKAHYKFIKTASRTLLGYHEPGAIVQEFPVDELDQLVQMEAEALYTILRQCHSHFDQSFDALSAECHLLQAINLSKILRQTSPKATQIGTTKSSLEILDEDVFDIYHDPNTYEALKLQEFMSKLETRVHKLRATPGRSYENDLVLASLIKLIKKISSFLITDPLMKFITGGHTLLEKIEEWNRQPYPKADKLVDEAADLVDLIDAWRKLETQTWRSSLHRVRRKYINDTLCDLWFRLYEAFNNPVACARDQIREQLNEPDFFFTPEISETYLYIAFSGYVKKFLEQSTLGDYQIRLDLVASFTVQTRFASLYDQAKPDCSSDISEEERTIQVDYSKLTTYVYNTLRQYQGLFESFRGHVDKLEKFHHAKLDEKIKIVSWRNRNFCEIKKNLRNSHRMLNSIMNAYLGALKEAIPAPKMVEFNIRLEDILQCNQRQASVFEKTKSQVDAIILPPKSLQSVPLKNAFNVVDKFRMITEKVYSSITTKTIDNFTSIEQVIEENAALIENYKSHDVDKVVIQSSDKKEVIEEKQKKCRQMRHSKRYALQAIFKNLREAGVSHQRGLSNDTLDTSILAMEPLREVMQRQTSSVLQSATELIDNSLVSQCNEMFLRLSANIMFLLSQPNDNGLTSDQYLRIRGLGQDMIIEIIKNNEDAAVIYKSFMSVQAAAKRLQNLLEQHKGRPVIIYNYERFHKSTKHFNKLVSRAYTAISKLDKLLECQTTVTELEATPEAEIGANSESKLEKSALLNLITEIDPENSLITTEQSSHIRQHLSESRQRISEVSDELRDRLRMTKQNHLFAGDDIKHLQDLYEKFLNAYRKILPEGVSHTDGTILGSMYSILVEAEHSLKPKLEQTYFGSKTDAPVEVANLPNAERLNLRLQKLVKEAKLAMQSIYQESVEADNESGQNIASASRSTKAFNSINSTKIRGLLRESKVATCIEKCFMTINLQQTSTDITSVASGLSPILSIYTQNVACHLNIIINSLYLKLSLANQLVPFFMDLVAKGFGLPTKADNTASADPSKQIAKQSDDNTGFGEGKGEQDVSKKLEFESQLDDLKDTNGDKDKNNGQEEDNQPVEAHDDGVEMTDDIDAEAQGPDEGEDQSEPEEDENDDEPIDENALDQQLDSVDDDNNTLDKRLWGDDEGEGDGDDAEDDEQDLRETTDKTAKPEQGEKEMSAKDSSLAQADPSDGASQEQVPEAKDDQSVDIEEEKKGKAQENEQKLNSKDADKDAADELGEDKEKEASEEVDMDEEASQALKENPPEIGEKEKNDEQASEGAIDMSIEEGGAQDVDGDTENEKQSDKPDENVNNEQEANDDDVSDDINLDDEALDERLESALIPDDPIEEKLRAMPAWQEAPVEQSKPLPGRKCGNHMIYDVYKEEQANVLDAPTGSDGQQNEQLANERPQVAAEQQQREQDSNGEAARQEVDATGGDSGGLEKDRVEPVIEQEEDNKSAKRTLANQSLEDKDLSKIKRQKIEPALEESTKEQVEGKSSEEMAEVDTTAEEPVETANRERSSQAAGTSGTAKGAQEYRHLTSDNASAVEVIDLASDSDDEVLNEGDSDENAFESANKLSCKLDESQPADQLSPISDNYEHLVHELSQQLQIVLQPTKMSKYKGDYKSGKRLNMRKIISYIASHYRKDKIWLRRTKPSKRAYNISLAIDNSSSMADNNCRQMTYQSLTLLAKSLSLIEAGSLSVVSFGEQVKCIHQFDNPYFDAIGSKWLSELKFNESRTCYSKMLEYSCEAFAKQAQLTASRLDTNVSISQLLVIVSDGRNVTSEQEEVKAHLKKLKLMGVLTLFIIVDDVARNNNMSILDVKTCIKSATGSLDVTDYMDVFPFPFYILLRQINAMPSILGNALRQWFELVSSH